MSWEGDLYVDTVLPFSLRSAPKIFSAIADTVEWIALRAGVSKLIHYLDDYLTMGKEGTAECSFNLNLLLELCKRLGLPLKWQKLEGLSTTRTFLGILFDTKTMKMCVPEVKLKELN